MDGVTLAPLPVQAPVPVWVGGQSRGARRRAARHDGWIPVTVDDERQPADDAGRRPGGDRVDPGGARGGRHRRTRRSPWGGTARRRIPARRVPRSSAWADAGATWWLESLHGCRGTTDRDRVRARSTRPRSVRRGPARPARIGAGALDPVQVSRRRAACRGPRAASSGRAFAASDRPSSMPPMSNPFAASPCGTWPSGVSASMIAGRADASSGRQHLDREAALLRELVDLVVAQGLAQLRRFDGLVPAGADPGLRDVVAGRPCRACRSAPRGRLRRRPARRSRRRCRRPPPSPVESRAEPLGAGRASSQRRSVISRRLAPERGAANHMVAPAWRRVTAGCTRAGADRPPASAALAGAVAAPPTAGRSSPPPRSAPPPRGSTWAPRPRRPRSPSSVQSQAWSWRRSRRPVRSRWIGVTEIRRLTTALKSVPGTLIPDGGGPPIQ